MTEPVSSKDTSSAEMKKLIMEQTEALMDAATSPTATATDAVIEEPETEETETTEQIEGKEEEPEKSKADTEPELEPETPPAKKEPLYKLKVEGKEEELPLEKVLSYAQQGRFLEKEKQRINEEKRRLDEERVRMTPAPTIDQAKAKEELFKALEENPFGTFGALFNSFLETRDNQTKEQRKADREFEKSREADDPDTWNLIKPGYQIFREDGQPRETAYLMAENELLRKALVKSKETGVQEGVNKAKARQKAQLPTSNTRVGGGKQKAPSSDEFRKLPSKEMAKHLPRARTPEGW